MIAIFVLSRVGGALIALAMLLILTRLIPPDEFARYSIAVLLGGVGQSVLLSFPATALNRFAGRPELEGRAAAFGMTILLALLLFASALFALTVLVAGAREFLVGPFLFGAALALHEYAIACLRTQQRAALYAFTELSRPLLGLVLILLILPDQPSAFVALLCTVASTGVAAVVGLLCIAPRVRPRLPERAVLREFALFGQPLGLVRGLSTLIPLTAQWLIARLAGFAEAGLFAAAYTLLFRSLVMLMNNVGVSTSAQVFRLVERKEGDDARALLDELFAWLLLIGVPVALTCVLVPGFITRIVFDESYAAVADHLPFLAVAALAGGFQAAFFSLGFSITKRTRLQLLVTSSVTAVHVVITYVAVSMFGGIGGSMAFCITTVTSMAIFAFLGREVLFSGGLWRALRQMMLAATLAVPLAWFVDGQTSAGIGIVQVALAMSVVAMALLFQGFPATARALRVARSIAGR